MAEISQIKICKLPYQEYFFVHGVRDDKDVWLLNNGTWTEEDGHLDSRLPFPGALSFSDNLNRGREKLHHRLVEPQ